MVLVDFNQKKDGGGGSIKRQTSMASSTLSVAYCLSPMEKLMLHLSPVSRRRSLRASTSAGGCRRSSSTETSSSERRFLNGFGFRTSSGVNQDRRRRRKNGFYLLENASLTNDVKTLELAAVKEVELELVDKLDILVHENKADKDYKKLFETMLNTILAERDPIWKDNGKAFIESVTTLLERLLDYRNALQAGDSPDKQMSCIVNLLDFYKSEPNREEMLLRYVYKLHDLHLPAENYVEAAFALRMHADRLQWSNRSLHADLRYPTQKEWERKEQLYLNIVDLFERGKHWEHAIPLCKELAEVYEEKVFNYRKLGEILKRMASLFEKIISTSEQALRLNPEYFRVGFYGQGFPLFLRNKEFVYRGLEFEKLPAFTQRITDEFPNAQILSSNTQPDDAVLGSGLQFIQICCVKPLPNGSGQSASTKEAASPETGYLIPTKIRRSRENMSIDTFQYDRPFHKGPKSSCNEFKTLWIERTIFKCTNSFPGILRWFEVKTSEVTEISPIQHACETMEAKNLEIQQMIADPLDQPIQKLSLSLQGVIDAAVNGGTAKYQEAFFSNEFLTEFPEHSELVPKLQRLMFEQVDILEQALIQHEKLISPEVRPLHEHLTSRWRDMKESLQNLKLPLVDPSTIATTTSPILDSMRRRVSRTSSSRKGPLPPVPSSTASLPPTSERSSERVRTSFCSVGGGSDGVYSHPSDSSSSASSSSVSLMTVSLSSLPTPIQVGGSSGVVDDSYHMIDYVDASPVNEGDGSPGLGMVSVAPPLPPRLLIAAVGNGTLNKANSAIAKDMPHPQLSRGGLLQQQQQPNNPPPPIPPKSAVIPMPPNNKSTDANMNSIQEQSD